MGQSRVLSARLKAMKNFSNSRRRENFNLVETEELKSVPVSSVEQYNLSAVAVSCVRNECVNGLQALLATLNETSENLAVVIGGIAVNKAAASKPSHASPSRHTREGGYPGWFLWIPAKTCPRKL